jgi:hypothetical protein
MDFVVPSNPDTGELIIASNSFEITGQNNLPFLPIFTFEDFDPKNGSEGDVINITGKVLTSITTGAISAIPVLDDIDYYFSGETNTFTIPMSTKSGIAEVNLVQNFNLASEINNFKILNINNFNYSSGRSITVKYDVPVNLYKKYYENHLFSTSGIISSGFQFFRTGILSGSSTYTIDLPYKYSDTDYAVFYNIVQTGLNYNDSYISNKTTGSFNININNTLEYDADVNVFLFKNSGFIFDSGFFERNYVDVTPNYSSQTIYLDPTNRVDSNLYPPFIFSSIEKINAIDIGTTYVSVNLYNLQKNYFELNIPNASNNKNFRLNYFTIANTGINLSTFTYNGNSSYYKKVYLLTGDANAFQESIPLSNLIIYNKNKISFELPSTSYYINGKIKLINSAQISKISQNNFIETPSPSAVLPNSGYRGTNVMIQGKSFKKPILIDNPYQYDSCFVRFKYSDNIYPESKSTFQTSFRIIDKDLLSGSIPLNNIPTGKYIIQMISEDGGLFE